MRSGPAGSRWKNADNRATAAAITTVATAVFRIIGVVRDASGLQGLVHGMWRVVSWRQGSRQLPLSLVNSSQEAPLTRSVIAPASGIGASRFIGDVGLLPNPWTSFRRAASVSRIRTLLFTSCEGKHR